MTDTYRYLASRRLTAHLEQMLSYVMETNPDLDRDSAETIVVAAQYLQTNFPGIQHHDQPGWFTQKARELGKNVINDPAGTVQKHLDNRERIRNAPVERHHRQQRAQEWARQMEKDLGHGVQRAKTTDEHVMDLGKTLYDKIKNRQTPQSPATPAQAPTAGPPTPAPSAPQQAAQSAPNPTAAEDDDDEDDGFDNSDQALKFLRGLGIKI